MFSTRREIVLAVTITALLSFLIHPTVLWGHHLPDLGYLAWIYLVPLVLALTRFSHFTPLLLISFASGIVGYYGLLYWLVLAMKDYGGFSGWAAFGALSALVVVMSLVFAVALGLALWVQQKTRAPFFILLPIFLLLRDLFLHHLPFGGYPWGTPAYSQGQWLTQFQWLDITGVYGLCALIYAVNGLIVDALLALYEGRKRRSVVWIFCLVFILAASYSWNQFSYQKYESTKINRGEIRIGLVQGNISQSIKWNKLQAHRILKIHKDQTSQAISRGAELVFWPESSYPFGIKNMNYRGAHYPRLNLGVPVLFGVIHMVEDETKKQKYNAIVLTNEVGDLVASYHKKHRVPFGEYLPLPRLKFMESLTQGIGELDSGEEPNLIRFRDISLAPLICIEDVFPRYAQIFSEMGADVLVNPTNDAWYGNTSAQHQHLVYSQFRALENRIPLIRPTNTGMSAVIDSLGQVVAHLEPFRRDILVHDLKIETGKSYYSIHGDSWMWVPLTIALGLFLYALIVTWRNRGT